MMPDNTNEQYLDTLLREWTARHTLSAAQAAIIRQDVLFQPEVPAATLSVAWWNLIFTPLATALKESTNASRYLLPVSIR